MKPNEYNITQNFITLEKDENYILISSNLTDQPKKTFVRLLHTDFLSLLEKWKTFNAMGAHEVTILEEDGKVKIKGIE